MNSNIQKATDLSFILNDLIADIRSILMDDSEFRDYAFDPLEIKQNTRLRSDGLDILIKEAEKTLLMIEPYVNPGMRVLEVGGGVGLTYAALRHEGINIVSLEPGSDGFGDRHRAGIRLLTSIGVDPGGWLKRSIEDYSSSGKSFDLIFSHFVLEHIPDLKNAVCSMSRLLDKGGIMIHRCPNYGIPYEPHFNIPLFPVYPQWTARLLPNLRRNPLWKSLQFTTVRNIRNICLQYDLQPDFRCGMTAWAFEQMLDDPLFAARKRGFGRLAKMMKKVGLIDAFRRLPPMICTPLEFTAKKKEQYN